MGETEIIESDDASLALTASVATTNDKGADAESNRQDNPADVINYHENRSAQRMDRRFAFEGDSNCLPMFVKRTLDWLALKIGHSQWLSLTEQERTSIGQLSTASKEDRESAKESIRDIMHRYGTEPTLLPGSVEQLVDPPLKVPAAVIEIAREVGVLLNR
jgi:Conserved nitrate reductase-associated protein (Nitr_red_assoc)